MEFANTLVMLYCGINGTNVEWAIHILPSLGSYNGIMWKKKESWLRGSNIFSTHGRHQVKRPVSIVGITVPVK